MVSLVYTYLLGIVYSKDGISALLQEYGSNAFIYKSRHDLEYSFPEMMTVIATGFILLSPLSTALHCFGNGCV